MTTPTFDELTTTAPDRTGLGLRCLAGDHDRPDVTPAGPVSCRCSCHGARP